MVPEDMDMAEPPYLNAGRLWAGGAATAIVAALAVVAGVLITRGVLGIPVLAPQAAGSFGDSSTAVYALLAAGCALLATGLLHVLLLGTPRPFSFFVWITGLADAIAAAAPFTQPAPLASKIFTAIINIVVGVAVITLLSGVGRSAARPVDMSVPTGRYPLAEEHHRGTRAGGDI
jgi:nicotinamide riboside transporter PnuC